MLTTVPYASELSMFRQALEQLLDRIDADLEVCASLVVEVDLDDALDAARADHHRDSDIEVVDAVLAGQVGRCGKNALLVLQIASAIAIALVAGA
jgi:hypothetical protein